jgi:hypothetical protein
MRQRPRRTDERRGRQVTSSEPAAAPRETTEIVAAQAALRSRESAGIEPSVPAFPAEPIVRATLIALTLARAGTVFMHSMRAWGLNHQRFLPPLVGWGLWSLALIALIPGITSPLERWCARAGEAIARASPWPTLAFAAVAALLWFVPDQVRFVGDFIVRLGAAMNGIPTATLFPQALPLDLLVHYELPKLLAAFSIPVLMTERVTGVVEAAAFAILCVAFARAAGLRGIAALIAAGVSFAGGYLGLFTGYGKAFRELCVVTAAVATFGVSFARSGRGLLPLGIAVATGMMLHRSELGLLVPFAAAVAIGWRHLGAGAWRRGSVIAGLAIPIVALVGVLPLALRAIRATDLVHVAPNGASPAQLLATTLGLENLREIANLLLAIAPLSIPALAVALAGGARFFRLPEGRMLLGLLVPSVLVLFFIHPRQWDFRDWDVFSPALVAISMTGAWLVARSLEIAPTRGLGVAVLMAAIVPTAQWLALNHDVAAGIARVRAYVSEPPERAPADRTLTWSYLGAQMAWLDSTNAAADAYGHAAAITPTPRLLYEWAKAEAERERYPTSRQALLQLTAKAETWPDAWAALAFVDQQMRDTTEARAAATRALRLDPNNSMALGVLRDLGIKVVRAPADTARSSPR